jgi:hypothetical protein
LHLQLGLLLLWLLLHVLKLARWLSILLLELLAREARLRNGLRRLLLLRGIASHLGLDGDGISRRLGGQIGGLLGKGLLLRWCLLLGIHVLLLGVWRLLARPGSVATTQKGAGAGEHDAGEAPDGIWRWGVGREMYDEVVRRGGAWVENGVVSAAAGDFPCNATPQQPHQPQADLHIRFCPSCPFGFKMAAGENGPSLEPDIAKVRLDVKSPRNS